MFPRVLVSDCMKIILDELLDFGPMSIFSMNRGEFKGGSRGRSINEEGRPDDKGGYGGYWETTGFGELRGSVGQGKHRNSVRYTSKPRLWPE